MMVNIKEHYSYNQNTIKLYTLDKAEKIVNRKRIYFLKQRLCGLMMMVIGIISPIIFDGDATFSLIAVPIGIGLLVTKQQVMNFKM